MTESVKVIGRYVHIQAEWRCAKGNWTGIYEKVVHKDFIHCIEPGSYDNWCQVYLKDGSHFDFRNTSYKKVGEAILASEK